MSNYIKLFYGIKTNILKLFFLNFHSWNFNLVSKHFNIFVLFKENFMKHNRIYDRKERNKCVILKVKIKKIIEKIQEKWHSNPKAPSRSVSESREIHLALTKENVNDREKVENCKKRVLKSFKKSVPDKIKPRVLVSCLEKYFADSEAKLT